MDSQSLDFCRFLKYTTNPCCTTLNIPPAIPSIFPQQPCNNLVAADNMDPGGIDYARFTYDHRIYRSFFLAGFSILVYDHLLTLHTEVKYIWKSKLRPSTLWFLLLSCVKLNIFSEVLVILQEFLIELTLIVRVFAMYGRNPWILAVLVAPVLLLVAVLLLMQWASITNGPPQILTAPDPGVPGCHLATPRTVTRPIGLYGLQAVGKGWAMYFGMIVLVNTANVFTFYFGDILLSAAFLSWFATSLSTTLLSHLILNLHEAYSIGIETEELNTVNLETLT
ncbi:hypothetical protein GGX14DRAFT_643417 [Mycena pura]|uniref:DUF6533 domain-containing protein n=1 Tax=Mycena pura TaxID=153505 RepID=A0AAD6VGC6_9AGAR|nr:hypothetical protein GGX14DRAFT_643417 [Mycena pura]